MTAPAPPPSPAPTRAATARYALGWALAGVVVATLAVVGARGDGDVALPPVLETRLEHAAAGARCELFAERPSRALNPRVAGPAGALPAHPGFYDRPLPEPRLVGALRAGTIVIHYRRGLRASQLDRLRAVQRAVPRGTVVVPNATGMPYAVAATAWRRLLGCRDLDDHSLDAVRLFRGRFLGAGA